MNRKGFNTTLLLQIIAWSIVLLIGFLLAKRYIVGGAVVPGVGMLP